MKRNISVHLIYVICILILITSHALAAEESDLTYRAKEFVSLLARADYRTATNMFDETMKSGLPEKKLKEVWQSLLTLGRPFLRNPHLYIRSLSLF